MSTFEQLRSVIADTLNIPADSIGETSTAEDIGAWDSLGHVNLMIALEQTFDIQLDVEVFPTLISVPAILDHLREQGVG
jgi:acyl carrier protein